jgi:hypothetical protein
MTKQIYKEKSSIISLLRKAILKLSSIEQRLEKLENKLDNSIQQSPNVTLYLNKSSAATCPQCNVDLSKNLACMSVNCPYACKVTC